MLNFKYKILIALFVFGSIGISQTLIPFDDSSAIWNVATTHPNGNMQNPNFVQTNTKIYGFKGDTTINSALWRRLFCTNDTNFNTSIHLRRVGYIRQVSKWVLFIDTLSNLDTLYNFNLHVGDSIKYNICVQHPYIFVSSIDSLHIGSNYYKRFSFSEPLNCPNSFSYLKEVWIENIGSLHNPLNSLNPHITSEEYPDTMNLTCYKQTDTVVWHNSNYNDCVVNIVLSLGKTINEKIKITLYPNPSSGILYANIEVQNAGAVLLQVQDMNGRLLYQQNYGTNAGSNTYKIDISSLDAGIYFVSLSDADGAPIKQDKIVLYK
ncbi:MAG: T9SS type A sorting domain-containing protein [Bacteroidetes bacterium]|nr:T9SS type A sorting domain-containing protein [Bacteroidota bacterium]